MAGDLPSALDAIQRLAVAMLTPPSGPDPLQLRPALPGQIAWVDFLELKYLIDPANIWPSSSHISFVGPDADDLEAAAEVEEQGGDGELLLDFKAQLKSSMADGLVTLFQWNPSALATYLLDEPPTYVQPLWDAEGIFYLLYGDARWVPHSVSVDILQLAGYVVSAVETDVLAGLLSVFQATQASNGDISRFWDTIRDSMTTSLDADPDVSIHYYANFRDAILSGFTKLFGYWGPRPGLVTESDWLTFSARHWRHALAALGELPYVPAATTPVPRDYNFITFKPYSTNVGIRLVHRQTWRHMADQRGDVVRTIPLGPRQTERVSTKILRRTKMAKSAEDMRSVETTTESAETTKDSTDILREASLAMNMSMNQTGEGGVNFAVWHAGGEMETGVSLETALKTSDRSEHLTETMQKVASKVRQESKVVISTEREETYEATAASEITNPNDEIAVTYVYSKLQRQYQILTQLAEIQDVVMVAEPLPRPKDVDVDWVRRYDWIIARVLLDDSYREALSSISSSVGSEPLNTAVAGFKDAMDNTITSLGKLADAQGSYSRIDFATESQKNYRELSQAAAAARERNELLRVKLERLYQHIRDNILHYCRAIWAQEDPQERILRYKSHNVVLPIGGPSVGHSAVSGGQIEVPAKGSMSVVDAIDPAGPIGYWGNYAVFYLRPEVKLVPAAVSLFHFLDELKRPYLALVVKSDGTLSVLARRGDHVTYEVKTNEVMDPALKSWLIKYPPASVGANELDPDTKRDMSMIVPALRFLVTEARRENPAASEFVDDDNILKWHYAEYCYLKERSRLCVVDTNSLVIDLLPGLGSTLETFKLAHRSADVLKAVEDTRKAQLENLRLEHFERDKEFYDPDKLIVVKGAGAQVVAAATGTEAAVEEEKRRRATTAASSHPR